MEVEEGLASLFQQIKKKKDTRSSQCDVHNVSVASYYEPTGNGKFILASTIILKSVFSLHLEFVLLPLLLFPTILLLCCFR